MALDPIHVAHEAPDEAAYERAILDGLGREIGFDAAFLVAEGERPTTVAIDVDALTAAFESRHYEDELAPLKRFAERGVIVDTRHATEAEVRRRRYHRDFAAPIGGRHTLLAPLLVRGRPLGGLMLGRTGSTFPDHAIARIAELAPSIAVGRASFMIPWRAPPLPRQGGLVARLGVTRTRAHMGELSVRDRRGFREMVRATDGEEIVWTRAHLDDGRSGWFYVELFLLAATRARRRRRALVLGVGGGAAVRQLAEAFPGIELDVVDRDPRALELARDWFGLDAIPRVRAHARDAVEYVHHAPSSRWDVVLVDLYDGLELAPELRSPKLFSELGRIVRTGGAIAFNVIGPLDGELVQRVARELERGFDDVRLVPVLDRGERFDRSAQRNVVVLGSRRPKSFSVVP